MNPLDTKRAQAQLGNAKEQEIYPVANQKGQSILVKEELKPEHTLFIKGMIIDKLGCMLILSISL